MFKLDAKNAVLPIVRQLFGIMCVDKKVCEKVYGDKSPVCEIEPGESRIGFDFWAFTCIIFQLRILNSYLFQWCLVDIRCEAILANRGGILINQLVEWQMEEQEIKQSKLIQSIKERMARIRSRYVEQKHHSGVRIFMPLTYEQGLLKTLNN